MNYFVSVKWGHIIIYVSSINKKLFQGDKYKEAEEVFETLLNMEAPPLKPDQKMFHMMIYMYKKAKDYKKAHKLFALMAGRGVPQNTVTYNSLMSFGTDYKEVAKIYDQVNWKVYIIGFFIQYYSSTVNYWSLYIPLIMMEKFLLSLSFLVTFEVNA